ncbi:hypothetical protein SISSUDRAFT_1122443 [Sistotremastrum suecicum HHB10207 ss-3]|uniref:C2H2-type domain-containing protein n=1 Tax=Sistotremastrum suecicum HHB10207 ss-3 TaxID=1314776 RepID=A0A165ZCK0_9AGAM|nr:hypothetical protein SISSUDRAFT_1122443 [Sistotremastrum suecicum HHB10207 ss-3]
MRANNTKIIAAKAMTATRPRTSSTSQSLSRLNRGPQGYSCHYCNRIVTLRADLVRHKIIHGA